MNANAINLINRYFKIALYGNVKKVNETDNERREKKQDERRDESFRNLFENAKAKEAL